jgi:hypothetical protein
MQYKRYKLSDRKTFSSMFFKEKDNLLHLFDNFLKKKGKYAIPGYPDKLGLLLFGPPGTGKTSLIKAMASHTGRSIINISLAKIKTNQELMDIFFDQKFSVKDEELPVKLSFSDVIFVLEDVDAASKIVHKRSKGKVRLRWVPNCPIARLATFLLTARFPRASSLVPVQGSQADSRHHHKAGYRRRGGGSGRRSSLQPPFRWSRCRLGGPRRGGSPRARQGGQHDRR